MEVDKRNRTELKSFFVKNAIPTEDNFADLIDGMLNQQDDGFVKLPDEPLSIAGTGEAAEDKKAIHFYRDFADDFPDWTLSLNTAENPGFNLSNGEEISRLFIDRNTGHLGIGTTKPEAPLHIIGRADRGLRIAVEGREANVSLHVADNNYGFLGLGGETKLRGNGWHSTFDGKVGIGTETPGANLEIKQADRNGTHPAADKALYITGDFVPDGKGVEFRHSNGSQGIGFGYNTVYATGSNANQDLNLKARGKGKIRVMGNLHIDSAISGKSTRSIREQLVHRRIIFGFAGNPPVTYDSNKWTELNYLYGPFEWTIPALQEGATRKFRLYAIYNDRIKEGEGQNHVRFRMKNSGFVSFVLPFSWGGSNASRDGYSNWFEGIPPKGHGHVEIQTTRGCARTGEIYHLELQAWDFFE